MGTKAKKREQLGMDPGTANHRLQRDILFRLVEELGYNSCFRCDGPMTRQNFSTEHIEPWLDSSDPIGFFFDLNNIVFSHQSCNYKAGRGNQVHETLRHRRDKENQKRREHWASLPIPERQKNRRDRYERYGV